MTWAKLLSACLIFPHPERIRERDAEGRLVLTCPSCGNVQRQLTTPIIKGPQHTPARVPGTPNCKAKIERRDNVTYINERQSS